MPDAYPHQNPTRPPQVPPHQRFGKAVEFVRFDLHTKLWGKQAEILRLLKHSKRTAVRSCNGSGKTHVAAAAVIWWLLAHEHKSALAITTAPTQRQVTNLLWREIRNIVYRNPWILTPTANYGPPSSREGVRGRVDCSERPSHPMTPGANETGVGPIAHNFTPRLTQTSLELSPNHYAMGLSTDSPERFQGFHEENILFVVDEASGVHEDIFEAIEGSMTSRRARLLLIGNPTSVSGTFYKAFHEKRSQYKKIHISAFDTPNLTKVPTPVEGPSAGQGDGCDSAANLPLLREGAGGVGRLQRATKSFDDARSKKTNANTKSRQPRDIPRDGRNQPVSAYKRALPAHDPRHHQTRMGP